MKVLVILVALAIAIAQGAPVFITAYIALRVVRGSRWYAKVTAMSLSGAAWLVLTITGYFLSGGDGSFMKGFGMVLILCSTAALGSLAYLLAWLAWPDSRRSHRLTSSTAI